MSGQRIDLISNINLSFKYEIESLKGISKGKVTFHNQATLHQETQYG